MHRLCLRWRSLPAILPSRMGRMLSNPTFVSQHFTPDVQDMKKVVEAMDSDTRVQTDGALTVKICRLCTKGNKDNAGNLWKLQVRKDGSYYCHRCALGMNLFHQRGLIRVPSTDNRRNNETFFQPTDIAIVSDSFVEST